MDLTFSRRARWATGSLTLSSILRMALRMHHAVHHAMIAKGPQPEA